MPRGGPVAELIATVDRDLVAERAARTLSAMPRPFLRWAGSKRMLLSQLVDVLPETMRVYREPFLGSGSLFFLLEPQRAVLSDSCGELIETFEAVRDDASAVLRHLDPMKPDRDYFYHLREHRGRGRYRRAAEFIYLNKTCWNGLYRVNSSGVFNVPYGAPKSDRLIDTDNLRSCGKALRRPTVSLRTSDFEAALTDVGAGDLVFLDPPYVTHHNNNGFVDYNEQLFSWDDQLRAAAVARRAAGVGAHVIVMNALHDDVVDLYDGFKIRPIARPSTLASTSSFRGPVLEALLWRPGSE